MTVAQLSPLVHGRAEQQSPALIAMTPTLHDGPDGVLARWVLEQSCAQVGLGALVPAVVPCDNLASELEKVFHHQGSVLLVRWGAVEEPAMLEVAAKALCQANPGGVQERVLPLPVPLHLEGALIDIERSSPQAQLAPFVAAYPGWRQVRVLSCGPLPLLMLVGGGHGGTAGYERAAAQGALLEAMQGTAPGRDWCSDGAIYALYLARIIAHAAASLRACSASSLPASRETAGIAYLGAS